MNRYPQLSNTARTRILCQLFSDQIPVLLGFISQHDKLSFSFDRLLLSAKRGQKQHAPGCRKDPANVLSRYLTATPSVIPRSF